MSIKLAGLLTVSDIPILKLLLNIYLVLIFKGFRELMTDTFTNENKSLCLNFIGNRFQIQMETNTVEW
jgi:hypothetical protein